MKKFLFILMLFFAFAACTSNRVVCSNERHGIVYGIKFSGKPCFGYVLKVWSGRYYTVYSNDYYQVGDTVYFERTVKAPY